MNFGYIQQLHVIILHFTLLLIIIIIHQNLEFAPKLDKKQLPNSRKR